MTPRLAVVQVLSIRSEIGTSVALIATTATFEIVLVVQHISKSMVELGLHLCENKMDAVALDGVLHSQ